MAPDASPGRPVTLDQTLQGFAVLQARLRAAGHVAADMLVVLEATGSYGVSLATTRAHAGVAVAVITPDQAHHVATAVLQRAKTDALDARTLARLAATLQPAPWTPPPAIDTALQQRLSARDTLIGLRPQVRNQRHALVQVPVVIPAVRARLEEVIATVDAQSAASEREMTQVLPQDADWAAVAALLVGRAGVRVLMAAWLLVTTLTVTIGVTPAAVTAYAGLVPVPTESGTSVRGRGASGHGGNTRLRTALSRATLSATRYTLPINAFYERLRAAGTPTTVARCAAARTLVHLTWAVVRKGRSCDPFYAQQRQETA